MCTLSPAGSAVGAPSAAWVVGGGASTGQEAAEANPAPPPSAPPDSVSLGARGSVHRGWSSQAAGGACGGSGLFHDIFKPKPRCCLQPFLSHFLLEDSILGRPVACGQHLHLSWVIWGPPHLALLGYEPDSLKTDSVRVAGADPPPGHSQPLLVPALERG